MLLESAKCAKKMGITRISGRVEEVTADRLRLQCQRSEKNGNLQALYNLIYFIYFIYLKDFLAGNCWYHSLQLIIKMIMISFLQQISFLWYEKYGEEVRL